MRDTPPVSMSELEDALHFGDADELEAYLNLQTGEFVFISPEGCVDEELPDDLEDEDKRPDAMIREVKPIFTL